MEGRGLEGVKRSSTPKPRRLFRKKERLGSLTILCSHEIQAKKNLYFLQSGYFKKIGVKNFQKIRKVPCPWAEKLEDQGGGEPVQGESLEDEQRGKKTEGLLSIST